MQDHLGVNQSRLFLAELFCGKAISLQITGAPIREEHVGILQKAIELRAIFFGAIQERGSHSNLYVQGKGLNLRITGSPDVKDVGAVVGEVSADSRSGNHVPQSERTHTLQWALCAALKRYRLALADFFQSDQRHSGEHFGVLGLVAKLLVGAHHPKDQPSLRRGRFQLLSAPLQNGIANGFAAVAAPQEIERPRLQAGVNVESNHMTPIACFPKERQLKEWVVPGQEQGATSVERFPFTFEETTEAPQSFPDIDMNVLSFAGLRFPERRQGDRPGSQADRGHGAKLEAAGHDRILSVESKFAATILCCQSHIREHLIHSTVEVELG